MEHDFKKKIAILFFGTCFLVILDQLTKWLAVQKLQNKEPFVLINGVFELHYLENYGSAFGLLQGQRVLFVLLALAMLVIIPYLYMKLPCNSRFLFLRITSILFLSGAIGNAIDRITHVYVVDFLYFSLINFPIFNVADIYVTLAGCSFVLLMIFYYKEEELEGIFNSKLQK